MILLDASSSMTEKSFDLGMATAFNILDTLGEDDFVNLITFSEVVKTPVPCFKDRMVRATPDNIQEIKSAVKAIKLQDTANFTAGLEYAFSLLHKVNACYIRGYSKINEFPISVQPIRGWESVQSGHHVNHRKHLRVAQGRY